MDSFIYRFRLGANTVLSSWPLNWAHPAFLRGLEGCHPSTQCSRRVTEFFHVPNSIRTFWFHNVTMVHIQYTSAQGYLSSISSFGHCSRHRLSRTRQNLPVPHTPAIYPARSRLSNAVASTHRLSDVQVCGRDLSDVV